MFILTFRKDDFKNNKEPPERTHTLIKIVKMTIILILTKENILRPLLITIMSLFDNNKYIFKDIDQYVCNNNVRN